MQIFGLYVKIARRFKASTASPNRMHFTS
jgi:hypothetical protein